MAVLNAPPYSGRPLRAWAAWLALLAVWLGCEGASAAQEPLDVAVKATYLYKLAPFIDWPPGMLEGGSSFDICVVGADPFGVVLDRAMAGQRVANLPIVVRRLPVADRNSSCRMMYLGGSAKQSVKDGLAVMRGSAVLTVTDGQKDAGMIAFTIDQGRVKFRIDDQAAADSGLMISSKLLSLAVAVIPRRSQGTGP